MDRRAFLSTLAGSVLAAPLAAEAQPAGKIARLGLLRSGADVELDVFRQGLHELGYREGSNILVEEPTVQGTEDFPRVAEDLVHLNVNVILVVGTLAASAARDSIRTIPVVFVTFADPVRTGLVVSLARPGRNMTGLTMSAADVVGKRLELLREALPKVSRVAVLWNPVNRDTEEQVKAAQSAAGSLGLRIETHVASAPAELEGVFAAIARTHADAFVVLSDPMFGRERQRITGLAAKSRVPGMYHWRSYVDAGGLMSYGPDWRQLIRRAVTYVDKILKGAKPADLPVEQPTKFELVINLKTAKALGLTIPPSLLQRADHVIE